MGNDPTTVEPIDADAIDEDAKHRVLVTFPDDHSINGMKVEIIGVTPEQMAVAVFHLSRAASQVADARQLATDPRARIAVARTLDGLQLPGNGKA